MNFRFTIVETALNRAEFRWKWLRFVQQTAVLGSIVCLLVLLLGLSIVAGWLTSKSLATTFLVLLAVTSFIAWAVIIISVAVGSPDRNWLAAAVERVDRRLMDRLNALLFLERRRRDSATESFALRIARQTHRVIGERPPPAAFSSRRALLYFCTLVLLFLTTILAYDLLSPWDRLESTAPASQVVQQTAPDRTPDLALPPTNSIEQTKPWGEVRITDPGTDLRVTKVDVVPLQIEASANEALSDVSWSSTVNGGEETVHELPAPSEPRYAAYQPTLYLDELNLSDWDVLTYYAKARAGKDRTYASDVYFIEVRPFREDILKMPGGENGKPQRCLNELSVLIRNQQHVIRETHQHVQQPPPDEKLQAQDRKKLAEAESDLSESARHLYAKMATEMENKPIGEALDNLAKADRSLDDASGFLEAPKMPEAQGSERRALSELIAARKMFQKAVSEHPEAFQDEEDREQAPMVDSSQVLNQMAEFRNESKAARDFVKKALERQKQLEQQARLAPKGDYDRLSQQENQLRQSLQDFQSQHPKAFKGSESQSGQAQDALAKAAQSFQGRNSDAPQSSQKATRGLEEFSQSMQNNSAERQLADAYKLKNMLDRQIRTLDRRSKNEPNVSDEQVQNTVKEARETINQLRDLAEQEPTRDAFKQPLRDSLSGQNKVDLDAKLNRLEQPSRQQEVSDGSSKEQRAADASQALGKVSKAFEESQPGSLQLAQKQDSLKPEEQGSLDQGISELDSLLKQLESGHLSKEDQGRQGRQALYNLQTGMRSQHGDNSDGNAILLRLQKMLKGEQDLDIGDLKQLLSQLRQFSVETATRLAKREDQPQVGNIDPDKLPPAYRGRIQKYFQKLSER